MTKTTEVYTDQKQKVNVVFAIFFKIPIILNNCSYKKESIEEEVAAYYKHDKKSNSFNSLWLMLTQRLKVVILLFYNIDFGYPKRICLLNDLLLCCQQFLPAARVKTFLVKNIDCIKKYLWLRLPIWIYIFWHCHLSTSGCR